MAEMARSPLEDLHAAKGARMGEYHGARVPASFGDSAAEHHSARKSAGLFDFSFRAKFSLKGPDRARYLQRIISNDVKNLVPGKGTYATLLTAQGHIVADFRVYCAEDAFLLDTDADLLEKTIAGLRKYIIADRVTVEPLELSAISVQGPQSRPAVERVLGMELPALAEYGHLAANISESPVRVVQASSTGEEGYEIWAGAEGLASVWTGLSAQGAGTGAQPCGTNALESLRIEAGIPRYGQDFGEDTLPLEAGLLNALSFNKGCYIGQEIVERARSRGHVNWKLVGLEISSAQPPTAGEKLLAQGKEIGEVTSACVSPSLAKTIALGYVRREASEAGARLSLASGASAQVAVLPFYQSRREFCG